MDTNKFLREQKKLKEENARLREENRRLRVARSMRKSRDYFKNEEFRVIFP